MKFRNTIKTSVVMTKFNYAPNIFQVIK